MRQTLALVLLLFFIASCNRQEHRHSFYYWKLNHEGENTPDTISAHRIMDSLDVNSFYIHFMDVDWSEIMKIPIPTGSLDMRNMQPFFSKDFTPVVFITNRTFERMPDKWCDTLARRIKYRIAAMITNTETERVQRILDTMHINIPPQLTDYRAIDSIRTHVQDSVRNAIRTNLFRDKVHEIQIDCDWTAKTKEKYFRFLQQLKQQVPDKKISVTVRLYPYKYRDKMGVPPVDKGVLMCYNMGHVDRLQTTNSVFDAGELKQYLDAKDYPLPLDVALPIFGWYAWFDGPQFKGILYDAPELVSQHIFRKQEGNNYLVTADTVVQNHYLREGDILRKEYPDSTQLLQAAKLVTDKINYNNIIFYYWNQPAIYRYEGTIQKIFSSY
jgi:hypothetical protein